VLQANLFTPGDVERAIHSDATALTSWKNLIALGKRHNPYFPGWVLGGLATYMNARLDYKRAKAGGQRVAAKRAKEHVKYSDETLPAKLRGQVTECLAAIERRVPRWKRRPANEQMWNPYDALRGMYELAGWLEANPTELPVTAGLRDLKGRCTGQLRLLLFEFEYWTGHPHLRDTFNLLHALCKQAEISYPDVETLTQLRVRARRRGMVPRPPDPSVRQMGQKVLHGPQLARVLVRPYEGAPWKSAGIIVTETERRATPRDTALLCLASYHPSPKGTFFGFKYPEPVEIPPCETDPPPTVGGAGRKSKRRRNRA
jgi:hypothetical protein